MEIFLIVCAVIAWYGIGLVGSSLALGAMDKRLREMFPTTYEPSRYKTGDKIVGYAFAVGGACNLFGALIFGRKDICFYWDWLK